MKNTIGSISALIALSAAAASAEIIASPFANVELDIASGFSLGIDMNGDATNDFTITYANSSGSIIGETNNGGGTNEVFVSGELSNDAMPFALGEAIALTGVGAASPHWANLTGEGFSYVGVKFLVGGQTNLGWIQFYLPDLSSGVLVRGAWNNTPDATIPAGGGSAVVNPSNGPFAGGNMVLITNAAPNIGNGSDITNLLVGTVSTTNIPGQGTNWVRLVMPATGSAGAKELVIQSTSAGMMTLAGKYTVNPAGVISGESGWSWTTNSGLDSAVAALTINPTNGHILAGGYFTAPGFCKEWNGSTWTAFGAPGALIAGVSALIVRTNDNHVFAAGGSVGYCAEWDGAAWATLGVLDGYCNALTVNPDNGRIVVGGRFNGDVVCAEWDGDSWNTLGDLAGYCYALTINTNGHIVAGGDFGKDTVCAEWDGSAWNYLGSLDAVPHALTINPNNGRIVAGGEFTGKCAEWNGATWITKSGLDGTVWALTINQNNGRVVAGGSFTGNCAEWDGTNWNALGALSGISREVLALTMNTNNAAVVAGGYFDGYCQEWSMKTGLGVEPSYGSRTGGYQVVISGTNLCDVISGPGDLTNVTLCGVSVASFESVSPTQIIVTAGVASGAVTGDVRVFSASFGETVKSNAFAYSAAGLKVLGTNGAVVTNGANVALANGSDFGHQLVGSTTLHAFSITNNGTDSLTISGISTNGPGSSAFIIQPSSFVVPAGSVSSFAVSFTPSTIGNHTAALVISNDSPASAYTVNLAGSGFALSPNNGPFTGGNTITITNGNFGNITNVLVGGVRATLDAHGDNWFTIALPAIGVAGVKDIVVQTDGGDILLAGVYTVNPFFMDAHLFASLGTFAPTQNLNSLTVTVGDGAAYISDDGATHLFDGVLCTNAGATNWVFTFDSFILPEAASLTCSTVSSNNPFSIVFLSKTDMTIAGAIGGAGGGGGDGSFEGDVGYGGEGGAGGAGSGMCGGTGGSSDGSSEDGKNGLGLGHGAGGAGGDAATPGAGGGGGFGGAGGYGDNGSYAAGGEAYGDLPSRVAGGSGGGGGGSYYFYYPGYSDPEFPELDEPAYTTAMGGGGGGGGGGALQLGALHRLNITGTGYIDVSGGSGGNGATDGYYYGGDGAGGSGGAILIYAKELAISESGSLQAGGGYSVGEGGGGGGGGRIGIYFKTSGTNGGTVQANGGAGWISGIEGWTNFAQNDGVPFAASTVSFAVSPSSGPYAGGYEVVISGTNLCDGTTGDVIAVTICGVAATVTGVAGSTQIVMTAGAGVPGLGNVYIHSTSFGATVRSNAFTYNPVITAGAGMHGVVAPSGVVEVAYGGSTNFVVTADAYYHIGSLLTNGVSVGAATNQLVYTSVWANVIASGVFAATFAENLTINTGTPEWWLAQYGWTNNFEIAAVNDTDGDDMQAWTEYLAGTDPTNRSSFLGFDSIAPEINGAGIVIRWSSVTDKVYQLDYSVNLPLGFSTLRADILATPPENAYTDTVTGVPVKFYRVALNQPAPSGMVLIPAGNNSGSDPDFGAYTLTVSAFYMDSTLVTKAKWDEVYIWALTNGYSFTNAGSVKATNHPVQTVNWHDCAKWCNARSEKEGRPVSYRVGGSVYRGVADNSVTCATNVAGYRLPTDVEFHYAARGGLVGKRFPWGDTIDHTKANYWGYPASSGGYAYDTGSYGYDTRFNTGGEPYTSPVDTFAANGYGLYDMAGNLWEWCTDWHPGYEGSERVLRGGCWNSDANDCQVGLRNNAYPGNANSGIGFRAVLPPGQ